MGFFSSLVGAAVGFLVGGPVGAIIGAGIGATKVGEKIVNSVMDFVLQPFMPSMPDMGGSDAAAQREQGVLVQRQGSTSQIPVVYGYRKVGTAVSFAETGSASNKYLYVAYVLAEGTIEGLREVYIDDWQLPVDQVGALNGGSLVTVNADRYKDRVQLRFFPGVNFANPRSSTVGSIVKGDIFAESPTFTTDMIYNGLAVIFARYEWREIKTQADADANPFSGNIPELSAGILGKRVASLLVDTTETQEYDVNAVRYSTNPAECLLDYLRNPRYGKGLLNADIDYTTFKAAARKCNQTVTYLATQNIQGPILTLNMVVNTDTSLMSNVKTMLQNFRAYMPYVQGKYKLRIEDAGNDTDILSGAATIVQTLTKDDIVSDVTFTGIDRSSKYNVVQVTYVDPDQKFSNQTVIYPETEAERQVYIDRDGGRENKYETTLGGITNYAIAKDFARLIFNKQRRQESCVFTAISRALELEPGDSIRINSNILNFGTDPWRVVSVKVNNDMTVDLGCVRNPDDIYPYTRVGEEDIVLPTYVPKGSIIYFPSSFNPNPLGLVPPTNAVFPVTITPVITNPPATDPNAPGGGGVGGGPDSGPPTAPPVVVVPPINVPPTPPPPPPPFAAVLAFKNVVYTRSDATSGVFTINFTQPNDGLYDYALFWWRPNQYSGWTSVRFDAKPGPGGLISTTIGPLSNLGQYEYYVRVYATDGRASVNVVTGYFRAVQSQTQLGELLGTGAGSTLSVQSGWELPASLTPTAPVYDDNIDFLEIRPKLSSGVPQNPRRMTVNMTQLLYTFTAPVNPLIEGIFVYYKYKDDVYWQREELLIPANKSVVSSISWDLAGDFGAPIYPVTGIDAITSPVIFQSYDFIVRLKYKDGTTALKQIGPLRGPVEINGTGLYNFVSVGTEGTASAAGKSQLLPIPSEIALASQQDPAKTYASGAALLPNFHHIRPSPTENKLFFRFNPPSNTSFRGYRIRYREVLPGADPDFKTVDVGRVPLSDGYVFHELSGDYRHGIKYEWQVVVKYSAAGVETESTNCFYCRASIPMGSASGLDLNNSVFNWETKDTKTVLADITAAFPAVATIIPQKWTKRQLAKYNSSDTSFFQANGATTLNAYETKRDSSSQPRLNAWFELTFQAPNQTFTSLICYRRVYSGSGAARTTAGQLAKYYGLGAWEKVTIPRASLTHQGSGVYTVNLRGPISYYVFNSSPTGGLFKSIYGPTGQYPGPGYDGLLQLSLMYPYFGVGLGNLIYPAEYLFVLNDGGEGTKAVRLTDFYTDVSGATAAGFKTEVDGIQSANQPRDDYRLISDYNGFDAGFYRNINEALTNITVSQLTNDDFGRGFPRHANFTNWSFYLANPVGVTVY